MPSEFKIDILLDWTDLGADASFSIEKDEPLISSCFPRLKEIPYLTNGELVMTHGENEHLNVEPFSIPHCLELLQILSHRQLDEPAHLVLPALESMLAISIIDDNYSFVTCKCGSIAQADGTYGVRFGTAAMEINGTPSELLLPASQVVRVTREQLQVSVNTVILRYAAIVLACRDTLWLYRTEWPSDEVEDGEELLSFVDRVTRGSTS